MRRLDEEIKVKCADCDTGIALTTDAFFWLVVFSQKSRGA